MVSKHGCTVVKMLEDCGFSISEDVCGIYSGLMSVEAPAYNSSTQKVMEEDLPQGQLQPGLHETCLLSKKNNDKKC